MTKQNNIKVNDTTDAKPKTTADLEALLAGYTGSEEFYRHPIGRFVFTQGVKAMADAAQAYWLLDVIGSYQPELRKQNIEFQLWIVESKGNKGVVAMREDTNEPTRVHQEIEYTDFPEGRFELYYVNDTLLLKSEY